MPSTIETMVRVRSDAATALDFLKGRFAEFFSKVNTTSISGQRTSLKGGSLLRPYGFKATVVFEQAGPDTTVLKISGRPKMNLIAYVLMLVVATLLIFGLSSPEEGFWAIMAALVMIIASIVEQRRVKRQIQQVSVDLASRFQ